MSETYRVDGLQVVRSGPPPGRAAAGPPLLLVHGASHGAWCWELWQARLAELGWVSHALSLRNHPGSFPVEEEIYRTKLKMADYTEDVAAVAGRIVAPFVVVAHSMGGMVAQSFVARVDSGVVGTVGFEYCTGKLLEFLLGNLQFGIVPSFLSDEL